MHRPDPRTPLVESVQVFDELVEAGKVRYWGVSNFSAQQTEFLTRYFTRKNLDPLIFFQIYRNTLGLYSYKTTLNCY